MEVGPKEQEAEREEKKANVPEEETNVDSANGDGKKKEGLSDVPRIK